MIDELTFQIGLWIKWFLKFSIFEHFILLLIELFFSWLIASVESWNTSAAEQHIDFLISDSTSTSARSCWWCRGRASPCPPGPCYSPAGPTQGTSSPGHYEKTCSGMNSFRSGIDSFQSGMNSFRIGMKSFRIDTGIWGNEKCQKIKLFM